MLSGILPPTRHHNAALEGAQDVAVGARAMAVGVIAFLALVLLTPASATSGPSAHWSFDEGSGSTAADGVGNLDGSIDGATWIADGATGSALRFDGNDRVTIADDAVLRTPELGVRLWIRGDPASPPATGQVILEKGDLDCGGGSYAVVVDGDRVALRYRETAGGDPVRTLKIHPTSLPTLWDGQWHQIAFSNRDGEWGHANVYHQGWMAGMSAPQHSIPYSGLDVDTLAIGAPANASCGGSGFTGDIDQVSIYPRLLPRDELAAAEPQVATTIEVESVNPLEVDNSVTATVRVQPVPLAPGRLVAWLTAEDGVRRIVGAVNLQGYWQIPADGRFSVPLRPEDGGEGTLEFHWEPSLPQLGSSATVEITVKKAASSTNVPMWRTYVETQPIYLVAQVSSGAYVKVNGTVELYEVTPGGRILLDTQPAVSPVGSFGAHAEFTLPARPVGSYELEARFLGGTAHLPSTSPPTTLAVQPAPTDTQPPVVNGAWTNFEVGTRPAKKVPVLLQWIANDNGPAGIASFDVGLSQGGGAWSTVATGITASRLVHNVTPGSSYRFRIRATDWNGNRSAWYLTDARTISAAQEKSTQIKYSGKWKRATGSAYWKGAAKHAAKASASATFTYTGRSIAWVSPVGPGRGIANVYIDGSLVRSISLRSESAGPARVMFQWATSSVGTHTIQIEVVGGAPNARVDVDGFVVMR